MKFLFCTDRTHLPDQGGGAERSIDTLLRLLIERGHESEAVVAVRRAWRRKAVRRIRFFSAGRWLSLTDRRNPYPTHRTARRWVTELLSRRLNNFQPDVVITQLNRSCDIAQTALASGIRVVAMVRDAEFDLWTWPKPDPRLSFVSNSKFIADQLRQRLALDSTVVHPLIQFRDYYVAERVAQFVTFVNPIPRKGLDLAVAAAGLLPHRRFLFVQGSLLTAPDLTRLRARLSALPNVTFMPWNPDMRRVYSQTALLIVPSQWEEAFGRVALEAQVSGIPVIGRDVGGLSEVLEESGTVMAREAPPEAWAEEIERTLADTLLYATRSEAAKANAARPAFDPQLQVERFLALLSES